MKSEMGSPEALAGALRADNRKNKEQDQHNEAATVSQGKLRLLHSDGVAVEVSRSRHGGRIVVDVAMRDRGGAWRPAGGGFSFPARLVRTVKAALDRIIAGDA